MQIINDTENEAARNFKKGIAKIWRSLKTKHGVISFDFEDRFWTHDTQFDFFKDYLKQLDYSCSRILIRINNKTMSL